MCHRAPRATVAVGARGRRGSSSAAVGMKSHACAVVMGPVSAACCRRGEVAEPSHEQRGESGPQARQIRPGPSRWAHGLKRRRGPRIWPRHRSPVCGRRCGDLYVPTRARSAPWPARMGTHPIGARRRAVWQIWPRLHRNGHRAAGACGPKRRHRCGDLHVPTRRQLLAGT